MKVAIASDHAGFRLKSILIFALRRQSHNVIDLGTDSDVPVDYPDFSRKTAEEILSKRAERGILICGSGVGASVAVNKFMGIRAGLCHDSYSAHQGVEHDSMNVLVFGARVIGEALAIELATLFLNASFSAEERHLRRIHKIEEIELKENSNATRDDRFRENGIEYDQEAFERRS